MLPRGAGTRRAARLCAAVFLCVSLTGCVKWDERLDISSAQWIDARDSGAFATTERRGTYVGLRVFLPADLDEIGSDVGRDTHLKADFCRNDNALRAWFDNTAHPTGKGDVAYDGVVALEHDDSIPSRRYDLRTERSDICIHAQTIGYPPDLYWGKVRRLAIPPNIAAMARVIGAEEEERPAPQPRP